MAITFTSLEKVSHAEDRLREARFWSTRTIAARVIAGWELADSQLRLDGAAHESENRAAWSFRRVKRTPIRAVASEEQ